jgi:hypothetical protein
MSLDIFYINHLDQKCSVSCSSANPGDGNYYTLFERTGTITNRPDKNGPFNTTSTIYYVNETNGNASFQIGNFNIENSGFQPYFVVNNGKPSSKLKFKGDDGNNYEVEVLKAQEIQGFWIFVPVKI